MPIAFPEGSEPQWCKRYVGRLQYELDDLQGAGIDPVFDEDAWHAGQVQLTFSWRMGDGEVVNLRAIYPDSFPHMRPHVLLESDLDPFPTRHIEPMAGNICLLGRDPRQWTSDWSLKILLDEQLEHAIRGTGEEDPQAEPADFWWNVIGRSSGRSGSMCLVDSACDLGLATNGTLTLRYAVSGPLNKGKADQPVIRALVDNVKDETGNVIHEHSGSIPSFLSNGVATAEVCWKYSDATLLPIRGKLPEFVLSFIKSGTHKTIRVNKKLAIMLIAIAHPVEITLGEFGIGWIFVELRGHPSAFRSQKGGNRKKKQPPIKFHILPAYRAGLEDLSCRAPSALVLREKRVIVIGTGAIGSHVALELARNGCSELHLLDFDHVEPGNSVRWALGASTWGQLKVDALKTFIENEYPGTDVFEHSNGIGHANLPENDPNLDELIRETDLVVDCSVSFGVTMLLSDICSSEKKPLISAFATPNLNGGGVIRYSDTGGCPNCLEHAWHSGVIVPPPGFGDDGEDDDLFQPPGCSERTFSGPGYDLQEVSLQTVRLAVETLNSSNVQPTIIQTLALVDETGVRSPPKWRNEMLEQHSECTCRR